MRRRANWKMKLRSVPEGLSEKQRKGGLLFQRVASLPVTLKKQIHCGFDSLSRYEYTANAFGISIASCQLDYQFLSIIHQKFMHINRTLGVG